MIKLIILILALLAATHCGKQQAAFGSYEIRGEKLGNSSIIVELSPERIHVKGCNNCNKNEYEIRANRFYTRAGRWLCNKMLCENTRQQRAATKLIDSVVTFAQSRRTGLYNLYDSQNRQVGTARPVS